MQNIEIPINFEEINIDTLQQTCKCKAPTISLEKEKSRIRNIEEFNLNNLSIDDPRLVSIAKLAALTCKKPVGLINIVSEDKVIFFARYNFSQSFTSRENSFCQWVIEQDDIFQVTDTLLDHRFENSEFVKTDKDKLRFYAGHPLKSHEGYNMGSLCICDLEPGELNEFQKSALKILSEYVINLFELNKQNVNLTQSKNYLEKLLKVKEDSISNITHELRTPLNAIHGFSEILIKQNLAPETLESIQIIKNSSEILTTILNDFLDLCKINSSMMTIDHSPFELYTAVKSVYDLLHIKAESKFIKFILEYDEKIPKIIVGDKIRINQIIMNLVGNSIKFTEKGYVKIKVILIEENDTHVVIKFSVKDSGIGIKKHELQRIFNRYEQAQGCSTFTKYGGTGLGLNISKKLVELHGGEIKVESIFEQGSEFYFTLKYEKYILKSNINVLNENKSKDINQINLSYDSTNSSNSNSKNITTDIDHEKFNLLKKLKILVCEDNQINIKLIEHNLKNNVQQLDIVYNGLSAIETLKNKYYDLVLMDIQMPEMDGIKATQYIRQVLNQNIAIFGFTANITQEEKQICIQNGMDEYILKTHDFTELFEKIVNFFKKKNLIVDKYSSTSNLVNESQNNISNSFFKTVNEAPPSPKKFNKSFLNEKVSNSLLPYSKINIKSGFQPSKLNLIESPYKNNIEKKLYVENFENCSRSEISVSESPPNLVLEEENDKLEISLQLQQETYKKNIQNKICPTILDHIDINLIKEISGDDEKFEKEFIEVFLHNITHDAKMLENDILLKNIKQINFWIHKMKTPLIMLGLFNILETANKISEYCNINIDKLEIKEALEKFNLNLHIIIDELQEILKKIT